MDSKIFTAREKLKLKVVPVAENVGKLGKLDIEDPHWESPSIEASNIFILSHLTWHQWYSQRQGVFGHIGASQNSKPDKIYNCEDCALLSCTECLKYDVVGKTRPKRFSCFCSEMCTIRRWIEQNDMLNRFYQYLCL